MTTKMVGLRVNTEPIDETPVTTDTAAAAAVAPEIEELFISTTLLH